MMIDISDHALVRYIERIRGVSLDAYRNEVRALLSENKERAIPDSGYDNGALFILEPVMDRIVVITVLSSGSRPKKKLPWSTRTAVHVPDAVLRELTQPLRDALSGDIGRERAKKRIQDARKEID